MENISTKPLVVKIKRKNEDKSTFVFLFESILSDEEAEADLKAAGYEVLDVSDLKEKGIL